jgi:hypothetical protein
MQAPDAESGFFFAADELVGISTQCITFHAAV